MLRFLFDYPCLSVTDNADSAPCPAQSNFSHGRGTSGTWGARTPTCPQPATPSSVLLTTDQKLTPRTMVRGILALFARSVWLLISAILNMGTHYYMELTVLKSHHVAPELNTKRFYTCFFVLFCFSYCLKWWKLFILKQNYAFWYRLVSHSSQLTAVVI